MIQLHTVGTKIKNCVHNNKTQALPGKIKILGMRKKE